MFQLFFSFSLSLCYSRVVSLDHLHWVQEEFSHDSQCSQNDGLSESIQDSLCTVCDIVACIFHETRRCASLCLFFFLSRSFFRLSFDIDTHRICYQRVSSNRFILHLKVAHNWFRWRSSESKNKMQQCNESREIAKNVYTCVYGQRKETSCIKSHPLNILLLKETIFPSCPPIAFHLLHLPGRELLCDLKWRDSLVSFVSLVPLLLYFFFSLSLCVCSTGRCESRSMLDHLLLATLFEGHTNDTEVISTTYTHSESVEVAKVNVSLIFLSYFPFSPMVTLTLTLSLFILAVLIDMHCTCNSCISLASCSFPYSLLVLSHLVLSCVCITIVTFVCAWIRVESVYCTPNHWQSDASEWKKNSHTSESHSDLT